MSNDEWFRQILSKIDARQDEQAITLSRLTTTVEEHVRRTNLLENDMEPVKQHVYFVNMGTKAVVVLVGLAATLRSLGVF